MKKLVSKGYSDNDEARAARRLCGAVQAPASAQSRKELSGNNPRYAVPTFLFKGSVPAFCVVDGVTHEVDPEPLNSGLVSPNYDVILVSTETRLVYTARLSDVKNLKCLYFQTAVRP